MPTGASLGKINKPSTPSSQSISLPPHSIPLDSTPRSLPFLMAKGLSSPSAGGSFAPTKATGTLTPTATLGAPQTICKFSLVPTFTVVTFNLSASGCCSHVKTSPTTTPLKSLATLVKSSNSKPAIVNCSPICSAVRAGFTHSLSHFSLNFIIISQKSFTRLIFHQKFNTPFYHNLWYFVVFCQSEWWIFFVNAFILFWNLKKRFKKR